MCTLEEIAHWYSMFFTYMLSINISVEVNLVCAVINIHAVVIIQDKNTVGINQSASTPSDASNQS